MGRKGTSTRVGQEDVQRNWKGGPNQTVQMKMSYGNFFVCTLKRFFFLMQRKKACYFKERASDSAVKCDWVPSQNEALANPK